LIISLRVAGGEPKIDGSARGCLFFTMRDFRAGQTDGNWVVRVKAGGNPPSCQQVSLAILHCLCMKMLLFKGTVDLAVTVTLLL
jgi:hypothetical protein